MRKVSLPLVSEKIPEAFDAPSLAVPQRPPGTRMENCARADTGEAKGHKTTITKVLEYVIDLPLGD